MTERARQPEHRGPIVAPEDVVLIGLDTQDGPSHPLYDPSVHDPVDVELAESLRERGQIQAIKVRRNGTLFECVAGRSRTKAARLVNKWAAEGNGQPISLRCELVRGLSDVELMELWASENIHRKDVPPLQKARLAQRLMDRGRSEAQVGKLLRVSMVTLRENWLPLLDAAPEIQDAMERGDVSAQDARTVLNQTHDEQRQALEESKREDIPLSRTTRVRSESKRPPLGDIRAAALDEDIGDLETTWRHALKWVLGEAPTLVADEDGEELSFEQLALLCSGAAEYICDAEAEGARGKAMDKAIEDLCLALKAIRRMRQESEE